QLAVTAVEQVDLQGANTVVVRAGLGVTRRAPETPRVAPVTATAVDGGHLVLALLNQHPDLHLEVRVALGRAQAALVELLSYGFSYALGGQVAVQARVGRDVLHGRLLPAPAAVGGEIAASVKIPFQTGRLAVCEHQQQREQQESGQEDGFSETREVPDQYGG